MNILLRPEKRYRVSEVLGHLKSKLHVNVSRQTLHNYTLLGLLKENCRTPAGHRLYGEDVFEELLKIERLKRHHTLAEIKKLIRKHSK